MKPLPLDSNLKLRLSYRISLSSDLDTCRSYKLISMLKGGKDVIKKIYFKPAKEDLSKKLTPLQYRVTQEDLTERPFENEFWDFKEKGIYVDIVTGEPLFSSFDKFDSRCGWPSFTRPISRGSIKEKADFSHSMHRVEVRSRQGDSHLGHVFTDGPVDKGGLRYCINSAALRFIPVSKLEEKGYEEYIKLFK